MENNKVTEGAKVNPKVLIAGAVLLVVLAIILIIPVKKPAEVQQPSTPSFPTSVISEKDVQWQGTYVYGQPGESAPAPTYNSKLSLDENIANFKASLTSGGWTITHEATATDKVPFFYATKGSEHVNITFVKTAAGVSVSVGY